LVVADNEGQKHGVGHPPAPVDVLLIVSLTPLKHRLNRYPVPDWVHQQVYLHPFPKELMLRYHL
jgi:hypothetical protein